MKRKLKILGFMVLILAIGATLATSETFADNQNGFAFTSLECKCFSQSGTMRCIFETVKDSSVGYYEILWTSAYPSIDFQPIGQIILSQNAQEAIYVISEPFSCMQGHNQYYLVKVAAHFTNGDIMETEPVLMSVGQRPKIPQ